MDSKSRYIYSAVQYLHVKRIKLLYILGPLLKTLEWNYGNVIWTELEAKEFWRYKVQK